MRHTARTRHPVSTYDEAALHHWESPHLGTRTEAPNGHGTITGWPPGNTLDRPVLDGATQWAQSKADTDNPWRGVIDPGLVTHPEWGKKSQRPRFFWWRHHGELW